MDSGIELRELREGPPTTGTEECRDIWREGGLGVAPMMRGLSMLEGSSEKLETLVIWGRRLGSEEEGYGTDERRPRDEVFVLRRSIRPTSSNSAEP